MTQQSRLREARTYQPPPPPPELLELLLELLLLELLLGLDTDDDIVPIAAPKSTPPPPPENPPPPPNIARPTEPPLLLPELFVCPRLLIDALPNAVPVAAAPNGSVLTSRVRSAPICSKRDYTGTVCPATRSATSP